MIKLSQYILFILLAICLFTPSAFCQTPIVMEGRFSAGSFYLWERTVPYGLGSTVAMTDKEGEVVNKYAYGDFGELATNSTETIPNPYKYVGKYGVMTDTNDLLYMRARYYVPSIGRFINKDPIGLAGGMNMYAYVGNNPTNLIDSNGLGPDGFKVFSSSQCYIGVQLWITKLMLHAVHHGKGIHLTFQIFTHGTWKTILEITNLFKGPFPVFFIPPEIKEMILLGGSPA